MSAEQPYDEPESATAFPAPKSSQNSRQRSRSGVMPAQHVSAAASHDVVYGPDAIPSSYNNTRDTAPSVPIPTSASSTMVSSSDDSTSMRHKHLEIIRRLMGDEMARMFDECGDQPPITVKSLAELDLGWMVNNATLRHDMNFQHDVRFSPNLTSPSGLKKIQRTEVFWRAMEAEFCIYEERLREGKVDYSEGKGNDCNFRLGTVLATIRDIMKTMAPDSDHAMIAERLDVEQILKQIRMGQCDLVDLADWIGTIAKTHCAPERDALVDEMRAELRRGVEEGSNKRLVSGLRQTMNILETMKLDVANWQIAARKNMLLENSLDFQRRYNEHRIMLGKIKPKDVKEWLQTTMRGLWAEGTSPTLLEGLVHGLLYDVLHGETSSIGPASFYLDQDRLHSLRKELHYTIYNRICKDVMLELMHPSVRERSWEQAEEILETSLSAIIGRNGDFAEQFENVSVEIVAVILKIEAQGALYDSNLYDMTNDKLTEYTRRDSLWFTSAAQQLHSRLVPKIQHLANDLKDYSAPTLHDMLLPPVAPVRMPHSFGPGVDYTPPPVLNETSDADDNIVIRFTHIILLHWHVWRELAYEKDFSEDNLGLENPFESCSLSTPDFAPLPPLPPAERIVPIVFPIFGASEPQNWATLDSPSTEAIGIVPNEAAPPAEAIPEEHNSTQEDSGANSSDSDREPLVFGAPRPSDPPAQ